MVRIKRAVMSLAVVVALGASATAAEKVKPPVKDLPAERQAAVDGMLKYLDGEIKSLEALQAGRKKPDKALGMAIERLKRHAASLGRMGYRAPGPVGKAYAGEDPYAYYLSTLDPGSIYLMDKFFEASAVIPGVDSPEQARVKTQLYMAERLSLLIHEIGHGGMLDYLADRPAPGGELGAALGEVRLRAKMGTGDADCYLAQYYMLRLLLDEPLAEYKTLMNGNDFNSSVLVTVLSQLKAEGVIDPEGSLQEEDGLKNAMQAAEMALAIKWGVAVPKTIGRKVAEPPVAATAKAADTPKVVKSGGATAGSGGAGSGPAKPAAEESDEARAARIAAAWSEVVARGVAARNNNKEGDSYRLEWLAPFAYRKKDGREYLVGCYRMWIKSPGKKEHDVFYFGDSAQQPGWLPLSGAVSGVEQYNREHPGQKIEYKGR